MRVSPVLLCQALLYALGDFPLQGHDLPSLSITSFSPPQGLQKLHLAYILKTFQDPFKKEKQDAKEEWLY